MTETAQYYDPKKPADEPTRGADFVDLIDPILFREKYPDLFAQTFPGSVKIRQGTLIIANEYILVDDEPTLQFMSNKGKFRLEVVVGELRDPVIEVKKYRFCGGKAVVLISSENALDSLYDLPLGERIRAVPAIDGQPGYIKPGGQGTVGKGQDGNTNTVGKGQGYPNAYGFIYPGSQTTAEERLVKVKLKGTNPNLKIAVLDSGIRYKDAPTDTQPTQTSCFEVKTGWDLVSDDPDPNDEHPNRHGTRIAGIIRRVCPEATLIPVRISNAQNVCTLYDVLCGLEYAAQQRVQLINASWVFSSTQGTYIPLLQASLRRLAFRGIIVVCAAGNIGPVQPDGLDEIPHIGQSKSGKNVPFLSPACSSEELENVITVTSVGKVSDERESATDSQTTGFVMKQAVCELRSIRFVTVGVLVNGQDQDNHFGSFQIPNMNDFRGTSFAAPYVTGLIANAMQGRADLSSRKDILRAIGALRDPNLSEQIGGGMWIEAVLPPDESRVTE